MKIVTKLYLSCAVMIGLLCLLTIVVSQHSQKIKAAHVKVNNSNQLVRQTSNLIIVLDEYLTYHYERNIQQFQKASERLYRLTELIPAGDARFIENELKHVEFAFSRLLVVSHPAPDISAHLASQIQVSANNILAKAFMLSQQAVTEIEDINQTSFYTVLRFAIILMLLVLGSSIFVIRGITKPLNILLAEVEKIKKRNLGNTAPTQKILQTHSNKNEVEILTRAFTSMASQLGETVRSAQLGEKRYRSLFESVGVSLWEEDYSEIQSMLEALRQQGISDFPSYIREHPEFIEKAALALKVLDVNDATLKLFKAKSKEELLGSLDKVFVPESFAVFCEVLVAMAEGRESFEAYAVNGTLDGEQIDILMAVSFPSDFKSQGRLTVSITNITELRRAEKEIKKHRYHLEQLVEERTERLALKTEQLKSSEKSLTYLLEDVNESREELQKVNNEYAAVNKELKEFAYIVSHDLKAPLRAISQLTHWISQDYSDVFDADGKMQMNLVLQRVKRMDGLIDGILRYSRLGRVREKTETLDLNVLVYEVIDNLLPPDNIKVIIENGLPVILRDSIRMEQVFQNLIGNAIKFMGKDEGVIKVGCVDDGIFWQFSISDNGPGIDEKYHDRIFQIFQTLAPRDERESTGIGLTLVKKIIDLYGGSIWLESKVGLGTIFFFTLPKKETIDEKQ